MRNYKPVWHNVFGDPVDLDDIDKRYALNILTMVLAGRERYAGPRELRRDPLIQKLRLIVLNGRDPNIRDRIRAIKYNRRARRAGLSLRAPVL